MKDRVVEYVEAVRRMLKVMGYGRTEYPQAVRYITNQIIEQQQKKNRSGKKTTLNIYIIDRRLFKIL